MWPKGVETRGEHGPVRFGECNSPELLHTIGDLKIKAPELLQISVRDSSEIKNFGSVRFGDRFFSELKILVQFGSEICSSPN